MIHLFCRFLLVDVALGALAVPVTVHAKGLDLKALGRGEIVVYSQPVPKQSFQEIVLKAVIDAPPAEVWAIVRDCNRYPKTMLRIPQAKTLSRRPIANGEIVLCSITIDMPFPYSDITSITEAVHTVKLGTLGKDGKPGRPGRWQRRWKLKSGDYKVNQGSWLLRPFQGDPNRTYVVYRIVAVPKAWVPGWIRRKAQKSSLPKLIRHIRKQVVRKKP